MLLEPFCVLLTILSHSFAHHPAIRAGSMWKYVLLLLAVAQVSLASPHQHLEAVERFREYLKIRTDQPTPDYAAAATFLIDQAEDMKLPYEKFEFVEGKPVIVLKWAGQQPELESVMLNSHIDVVPAEVSKWQKPPFGAEVDEQGNIYARGAQDMKCVGMQYLEAIRRLQAAGYRPLRTVYVTFVPDEEVGGKAGMLPFTESDFFQAMQVGVSLDEGWATPEEVYPVFYAERTPWWLVIRSSGNPGHGSKLYDNSAMEGLLVRRRRIPPLRDSRRVEGLCGIEEDPKL
ncbi:hypothetical protein CYMTET_16062 [Cymbomonas tetramitiformis]|uniref:N-acyl-aliphatic-L-amino acid amidohydrolase n=1 Tax=Cymbomonas tetramitiformis TaxID=36881 RepID=A0AAE0L8P9_9CHLO|nr:hypothetical protein CYMTET_16062 [Cymbomonas tetramitiformis]